MKLVVSEDLHDCVFIGEDGGVLKPAVASFVLMPDPKAHPNGGPCRLSLVTESSLSYCSTDLERGSFYDTESACDAFNHGIGRSQQEADELILASMGGGTA